MWQSKSKIGATALLNLTALTLMYTGLMSGFAEVLASDEAEQSLDRTGQLINQTAQAQTRASTASALPLSATPAAESQRNYQIFKLLDEKGNSIAPSTLAQVDQSIYLLGGDCLYHLPDVAGNPQEEKPLMVQTLAVPGNKIGGIPIQEFLQVTFWPAHKSLVVLDKSGSLFEYLPQAKRWSLLRANKQTLGSPDPHYVSIASDGPHLLLLDPERNQIWRVPASGKTERYFKDVLPWRVHAGDPNVTDGIGIAYDAGNTYVLRRSGHVSIYPATTCGGNGNPHHLNWKPPTNIAPSRIAIADKSPCYVIERENSRVLAIDRSKGTVEQFLFPAKADLRALLPGNGGFCIIDGSALAFRMLKQNDNKGKMTPRRLDWRLSILRIPIKGGSLPRHPGVFPGARRLYRHGVHQGLDFFHDPGGGTIVMVNTPAIAAAAGKVIRADVDYHDMDGRQYAKIMSECARDQYCSDNNEDLFRGCQVWIDHGNGLVTRYAHLNKARSDLRVGMPVDAGEIVGYIGYSGTGENAAGMVKHPHLHFEIWLDGHYLGYSLSPAETIALYQKIFSGVAKRGH